MTLASARLARSRVGTLYIPATRGSQLIDPISLVRMLRVFPTLQLRGEAHHEDSRRSGFALHKKRLGNDLPSVRLSNAHAARPFWPQLCISACVAVKRSGQ